MNRKPMLAKLHIARKDLGLDEDAYRAVLVGATGKTSAAYCSAEELDSALTAMMRLGWKPKTAPRRSQKPYVRKVFAIWAVLGRRGALANPSRQALAAFVKRQTGVDDPEWLDPTSAASVTEALKAMQKRLEVT